MRQRIALSTVSYISSGPDYTDILNLNLDILAKSNPDVDLDVYITTNYNKLEDWSEFSLKTKHNNVNVFNIRGTSNILNLELKDDDVVLKHGQISHAWHHSSALDKSVRTALSKNEYDYLIIFDADCFFIQNVEELIGYMNDNNLDVVGTPYVNSARVYHTQGRPILEVPTVFFMLIDLNKVDINFITMDYTKYKNYKHLTKIDCSSPFREYICREQKQYESFKGCMDFKCKSCFPILNEFNDDLQLLYNCSSNDSSVEWFIFRNKLCGVHLHIRKFDKKYIDAIDNMVNNGIRDIVIPDHPQLKYLKKLI